MLHPIPDEYHFFFEIVFSDEEKRGSQKIREKTVRLYLMSK
jgi:hypothetical protein